MQYYGKANERKNRLSLVTKWSQNDLTFRQIQSLDGLNGSKPLALTLASANHLLDQAAAENHRISI